MRKLVSGEEHSPLKLEPISQSKNKTLKIRRIERTDKKIQKIKYQFSLGCPLKGT
jgi:hypothetical protein